MQHYCSWLYQSLLKILIVPSPPPTPRPAVNCVLKICDPYSCFRWLIWTNWVGRWRQESGVSCVPSARSCSARSATARSTCSRVTSTASLAAGAASASTGIETYRNTLEKLVIATRRPTKMSSESASSIRSCDVTTASGFTHHVLRNTVAFRHSRY